MFRRDLTGPMTHLVEADCLEALWPAAISLVETAGYAALSLAEISPRYGPLWAKSSMYETWLYTYATEGFHAVDPLLLGAIAGQREMRLQTGPLWPAAAENLKGQAMNDALADIGYHQFDAMTFARPDSDNRTLVVLVSHTPSSKPEPPQARASRQLLMSTLAVGLHRIGAGDDGGFL
ncbi:MAG: hypothetical protein AAGE03_00100 [Pseudomonadota bacterium]